MFLVNFLNRNITDALYPTLNILYTLDVAIITAVQAVGYCLIYSISQAALPRNIRLRLGFVAFQCCLYTSSRLFTLYHEYFGATETSPWYLILSSVMKQTSAGYFTGLFFMIALDRWAATRAWAWYESGRHTIAFLFLQECFLYSAGAALGVLLTFELINDIQNMYICFSIVIVGILVYVRVYCLNLRWLRERKRGASIKSYSVSRTFQIKENMFLLKVFAKLAVVFAASSIAPTLFYTVYKMVEPDTGYDAVKYITVELHEISLCCASLATVVCIPMFIPQLRQLKSNNSNEISSIAKKSISAEGDTYFAMLGRDLSRSPRISTIP